MDLEVTWDFETLVNAVMAFKEEGLLLGNVVVTFLLFATGMINLIYCCKNNAVVVLCNEASVNWWTFLIYSLNVINRWLREVAVDASRVEARKLNCTSSELGYNNQGILPRQVENFALGQGSQLLYFN